MSTESVNKQILGTDYIPTLIQALISGLTLLGLELGGVLVKHMEFVRQEACIYLLSKIVIIGDCGKISFF